MSLKPYLLIDQGTSESVRFQLLSLKTGKIVSKEDHLQYLYEDYGKENIHHNISELKIGEK